MNDIYPFSTEFSATAHSANKTESWNQSVIRLIYNQNKSKSADINSKSRSTILRRYLLKSSILFLVFAFQKQQKLADTPHFNFYHNVTLTNIFIRVNPPRWNLFFSVLAILKKNTILSCEAGPSLFSYISATPAGFVKKHKKLNKSFTLPSNKKGHIKVKKYLLIHRHAYTNVDTTKMKNSNDL